MRSAALLLVLVMAVTSAGCASPPAAPRPGGPVAAPFALACPPGPNATLSGGACSGVIADPAAQLSEPSLAVMPGRPAVMAIGVHVVGSTALLAGQTIGGRVYVTSDGGASWSPHDMPIPGLPGTTFSDSSVAFDANGTLYAAGIAIGRTTGALIYVATSKDLGKTWASPQVLTPSGTSNDREWVTVAPWGTVFVSWQRPNVATSYVAWSADGGGSWQQATGPQGCRNAGPVAFVGADALVGCYVGSDGLKLFRVDIERKMLSPSGAIAMPSITPEILVEPSGGLVVAAYWSQLSRSDDGGRSWSKIVPVADIVPFAKQPNIETYAAALDPAGWLHLTLAPFHRGPPNGNEQGDPFQAEHVVLDPRTFALKSETRLTATGAERQTAPPSSLVPALGDDWWGTVFEGDRGALVWMEGGQIHVASLAPNNV